MVPGIQPVAGVPEKVIRDEHIIDVLVGEMGVASLGQIRRGRTGSMAPGSARFSSFSRNTVANVRPPPAELPNKPVFAGL